MVCLPGWGYGRWLYRIRPSVGHSDLVPVALNPLFIGDLSKLKADPAQVATLECMGVRWLEIGVRSLRSATRWWWWGGGGPGNRGWW